MPKLARDYNYSDYASYSSNVVSDVRTSGKVYSYSQMRIRKMKTQKRKKNPLRFLLSSAIVLGLLMIFMPYSFSTMKQSVFAPTPYKNISQNLYQVAFPVTNYLSNNWYLGERKFSYPLDSKDAQMDSIKEGVNIPSLQGELLGLMEEYPTVKPAIYVWDYETQNYIDINASKIYPVASIIKIPVLVDLFKSIENGEVALDDTIPLTEYYRSEGSGNLQYMAGNTPFTVDKLAQVMITESDNSATNMLMSQIGGMNTVNQSVRDWGLKNTEIHTWLPDMGGTNHSTAKEIAQMLYNIDVNEKFLTDASRNKIYDYMGHVHNDRLIQAGLGKGSVFYHKTGDIGKVLGDAGIVVTPTGKRYIVVILAHRPHNAPQGKDFIVKASEIIYKYMVR
ncbi:serine hydrolase [bacterium]|nr:serine hydrolase [bacterium]